jgi:hypothetical protein
MYLLFHEKFPLADVLEEIEYFVICYAVIIWSFTTLSFVVINDYQ